MSSVSGADFFDAFVICFSTFDLAKLPGALRRPEKILLAPQAQEKWTRRQDQGR
jgi:hypothetical protein